MLIKWKEKDAYIETAIAGNFILEIGYSILEGVFYWVIFSQDSLGKYQEIESDFCYSRPAAKFECEKALLGIIKTN